MTRFARALKCRGFGASGPAACECSAENASQPNPAAVRWRNVRRSSVKAVLEPLRAIPSFDADPTFYDDYGHENEKFTVRS